MNTDDWLRWEGEDGLLQVRVQPRASRTRLLGVQGGVLKVSLGAPPVDGAANQALCLLLAETFGLPKSRVTVHQGESSRNKVVRLHRPSREVVLAVIQGWQAG